VQAAADGTFVVYSVSDFSHPAELFRLGLGPKVGAPQALTRLNADVLKDVIFGESSSFTFPGWNGETVQSWQVKPPGFDAAKTYPLLLLMHGGPENAWDNLFHYRWNAQLFAAAGYVVILPNFHGSSGFGFKFMDAIKGQWGGAPYEDQMKAVDAALAWAYVDKTRLAAAGASYGGYMANWVEGHTDRFRAIVSHDGLYDMTAAIYSADFVGGTDKEFKGTPWENPQAGGTPYFEPPDDYDSPSHCRTCLERIIFGPAIGGQKWMHLGRSGPHEVDPGRWWDTLTGTWQTGAWSPLGRNIADIAKDGSYERAGGEG